jgi:hypothetical protein
VLSLQSSDNKRGGGGGAEEKDWDGGTRMEFAVTCTMFAHTLCTRVLCTTQHCHRYSYDYLSYRY